MSLLDSIKAIPSNIKKSQKERSRKQDRMETQIIKTREKYLPGIQRIAKKFGAKCEVLDRAAYVFKTINGREIGIHINYGTSDLTIQRKLETTFTKSATGSKIIRGITSAAHKAKDIRKELGEAREAIHDAFGEGGNMYENPNFGKGFK